MVHWRAALAQDLQNFGLYGGWDIRKKRAHQYRSSVLVHVHDAGAARQTVAQELRLPAVNCVKQLIINHRALPLWKLTTELSGRPPPLCRGQTRPTMLTGPLQ